MASRSEDRPRRRGTSTCSVYLDQEARPDARLLGQRQALGRPEGRRSKAAACCRAIALTNIKGDLRLERLRIGRWNGEAPREVTAEGPGLPPPTASIVYGKSSRSTRRPRSSSLDGRERASRASPGQGRERDPAVAEGRARPGDPRRQPGRHRGSAATLLKVEKGDVLLSVPGVKETLRLPSAMVRSCSRSSRTSRTVAVREQIGRLEMDGLALRGRLVDGASERAGARWPPTGSESASALRPGVSGRIVYRETATTTTRTTTTVTGNVVFQPQMAAVARAGPRAARAAVAEEIVVRRRGRREAGRPGGSREPNVKMAAPLVRLQPAVPVAAPAPMPAQAGVVIVNRFLGVIEEANPQNTSRLPIKPVVPCTCGPATSSRPRSRRSTSRASRSRPRSPTSTFVAARQDQGRRARPRAAATVRLNKTKRERLLTLPRMQKDSPPTHLIRSKNGDYLRGRVVGMDDKKLQVEVRLETKDVPRDRVSRIIWLHADETRPLQEARQAAGRAADGATRVQALRSDGIRLTFLAEHVRRRARSRARATSWAPAGSRSTRSTSS